MIAGWGTAVVTAGVPCVFTGRSANGILLIRQHHRSIVAAFRRGNDLDVTKSDVEKHQFDARQGWSPVVCRVRVEAVAWVELHDRLVLSLEVVGLNDGALAREL